jgi:hypothetical protein
VSYNATPVRDSTGNVVQAILVCQDITERKRAEYEFVRIRHNLETAQHLGNIGSWDDDLITGSRGGPRRPIISSAFLKEHR